MTSRTTCGARAVKFVSTETASGASNNFRDMKVSIRAYMRGDVGLARDNHMRIVNGIVVDDLSDG